MTLLSLDHYGLSADRGFLSPFEIDTVLLPPALAAAERAARTLPDLFATGEVRRFLADLPAPDIARFLAGASPDQAAVALSRYAFLSQAWVWGAPDPAAVLPANLAVPFVALSAHAGLPPIMNYAAYVLDSWYRIDKAGPIALGNIALGQHFAGGLDETWFILTHVAIEAQGGRALQLALDLVAASEAGDADAVETALAEMARVWTGMIATFDRIEEHCDPYIYYNRVRAYLHGWKNNPALPDGLIYEGVKRFAGRPQQLIGQTGSQSSIVPAMDALFTVSHEHDSLREFLAELHAYRPPQHRRFIEDLAAASRLRAFCTGQRQSVKDAFNACMEAIATFRTRHLEYAAKFITKQAGRDVAGTGGTPFMRYLKKHRDENRAQTI